MVKKIVGYTILGVVVGVFIFVGLGVVQAAQYPDGTLLKSPEHTGVYYIMDGVRRNFPNVAVYHTWFTNFNNVKSISNQEMESIQLGNPMSIKAGTKLLKFPLNPRIYSVEDNEVIRHIPDGYTASVLFGSNWGKNIIELPEIYYLFYTRGDALEKKEPPATSVTPPVTTNTNQSTAQGCYSGTTQCSSSQICLNNTCQDIASFIPTNSVASQKYCLNDQVYKNGVCVKAGANIVFYSQILDKSTFEQAADRAIAAFVKSADLENCRDNIRVHTVYNLCLPEGEVLEPYFVENFSTYKALMLHPCGEFTDGCSSNYGPHGGHAGTDGMTVENVVHEMGHMVGGLWDQYCYYSSNANPNPVNFDTGNCRTPDDEWHTTYCADMPTGTETTDGYGLTTKVTPYQCDGMKNKLGGVGIMGVGEGSNNPAHPGYHFTEQEIKTIKAKLGCSI
ncbi:MAG TPA: hypothetical protein DCS29_02520 [Candidatus Magasanikbacteria bacterium]|nr:MAG: hypothetical protein A2479_04160 [Candidatus Magasanikbacteria bacterium RIFOXYC2_FULL_39_8]HAT03631.1 hypothetical protein [Candidatus Magasanikbacteria bacterium]